MMIVLTLASAAVSMSIIGWLLRSGRANVALDQPNDRSLHVHPVPRVGGIGISAGAMLALTFAGVPLAALLVAGLAWLSFADDRRGLPIVLRFAVHAAASAVFLHSALPAGLNWLWPLVLPLLVWMTNLYNFMDGSDGLAGGMAVFGFGAYAVAAQIAGHDGIAAASLGIAAASAGFLVFNFPPARVFMGDAGSIPLGFLAGGLGCLGWARGIWPFWFPAAVFSPFIADATVTLMRRLVRGERVWQAHRTHYYQRLVRLGWGHRRTALAAYALMVLIAVVAVLATGAPAGVQWMAVAFIAGVLVTAGFLVDRAWRRYQVAFNVQD